MNKVYLLVKKKFIEGLESLFIEVEEFFFDKKGKKVFDSSKFVFIDGKGGCYGVDLEFFFFDVFEDVFEEKLG